MSTTLTRREPATNSATDGAGPFHESSVVVAFKTPMTPRPSTAVLRGDLTLRQTLEELQRVPPKDEAARRLIQQLGRETSGPYDILALGPQGELMKVDPERTKLSDIAIPREVRTPRGTEKVPTAAFEVQAYAPVGLLA